MTISIRQESTLIAFGTDKELCFFGDNAHKVAEVTGDRLETNIRGAEYIHYTTRQLDTVFPKLVARGYRICVIPN